MDAVDKALLEAMASTAQALSTIQQALVEILETVRRIDNK
jgi:hypothetical protein